MKRIILLLLFVIVVIRCCAQNTIYRIYNGQKHHYVIFYKDGLSKGDTIWSDKPKKKHKKKVKTEWIRHDGMFDGNPETFLIDTVYATPDMQQYYLDTIYDPFSLRKIQDSIFRKKRDSLLESNRTRIAATEYTHDTIKRDSAVGYTPSPPGKIKKRKH